MTELSYNQFRSLHKGTPQKEISSLWVKYKDGKYDLPTDEPTVAPEETPEVLEVEVVEEKPEIEEKTSLVNIGDLCKEYMRLQRKIKLLGPRLTQEDIELGLDKLEEIAKQTIPEGYSCTPTDSWKIWFGPTSKSLLINTTNPMAFEVTREWWQVNYQNTIYVDRELLNNNDLIDSEIRRYYKMGRFLPRTPVVGTECKLPQGVKDIQIRGGQGIN
jgi:hypothetical protein